ncbi:ATP-dependent zinc protease family protein [Salinimicrobium xinjiangense]|uniref:ATP-dependent zinc protease family protein n=1 Tax=Salinimicrobium xinjiangense TaxID=438596 RepID=UPI0004239E5C|nr:RimK/LysX family protein [Salinimicrobium xinjiangense]
MEKITIGRFDKADFPDLHLEDISIKVDTGAYTSSIHCDQIVEEKGILKCTFLDEEHPLYNGRTYRFKDYDVVFVKSSNGIVQKRYQIQTTITLFGKTHKISLSLSARQEMRFPVLLGRKFITRKFVVDTEFYDLSFKNKQE